MRNFEDYRVGERQEVGTHQLTREEIVEFARQWDPQPFHLDEEAARQSPFGGLTASGAHLVALSIRMIMASPAAGDVVAALGWDDVRFPSPARAGDLLTLTVECVYARPSRSRPDQGIIKNHFVLTSPKGEPVLDYTDTILMRRSDRHSIPEGQ
jgi:acyl dehydratase